MNSPHYENTISQMKNIDTYNFQLTQNQLTTRGDIEEKRLEQVLDRSCVDNGNQQISVS